MAHEAEPTSPALAAPAAARQARVLAYAVVLCAAAVPRIWLAVANQGIFWPDEIFQSLEQAHRWAFGYGYVSWEFQSGARSWVFAGFLGLWLKLLSLFGVSSARTLVIATQLLMVGLGLVGVIAAIRLAERLAGLAAAILAGALLAAFPPTLAFGGRCLSEVASAPLVVLAASLALAPGRRAALLGGGLAALAVFVRFQTGLFAVGLLVLLLSQRRWRDVRWWLVAAAAVGLLGGLLDWVTWGAPFHSLRTYVRYNIIAGQAAAYGVEPFTFYARVAWTATGPVLAIIVLGLLASARRALGLLLIVVGFVLTHSLVAHKELRFLMPIAPLALALAGAGLAPLLARAATAVTGRGARGPAPPDDGERPNRRRGARGRRSAPAAAVASPRPSGLGGTVTVWAVAALLAWGLALRARGLTFDAVGQHRGPASGPRSVWHHNDELNRQLWAAGAAPDLCGLALVAYGEIWTGGYSYLHRDVPILAVATREQASHPTFGGLTAMANYVISPRGLPMPAGYRVVHPGQEAALWRRDGTCAPPPKDYTRLFPE